MSDNLSESMPAELLPALISRAQHAVPMPPEHLRVLAHTALEHASAELATALSLRGDLDRAAAEVLLGAQKLAGPARANLLARPDLGLSADSGHAPPKPTAAALGAALASAPTAQVCSDAFEVWLAKPTKALAAAISPCSAMPLPIRVAALALTNSATPERDMLYELSPRRGASQASQRRLSGVEAELISKLLLPYQWRSWLPIILNAQALSQATWAQLTRVVLSRVSQVSSFGEFMNLESNLYELSRVPIPVEVQTKLLADLSALASSGASSSELRHVAGRIDRAKQRLAAAPTNTTAPPASFLPDVSERALTAPALPTRGPVLEHSQHIVVHLRNLLASALADAPTELSDVFAAFSDSARAQLAATAPAGELLEGLTESLALKPSVALALALVGNANVAPSRISPAAELIARSWDPEVLGRLRVELALRSYTAGPEHVVELARALPGLVSRVGAGFFLTKLTSPTPELLAITIEQLPENELALLAASPEAPRAFLEALNIPVLAAAARSGRTAASGEFSPALLVLSEAILSLPPEHRLMAAKLYAEFPGTPAALAAVAAASLAPSLVQA